MDSYCYIIKCADGSYYTGWTTNLERRLAQHNAGHGSRYTRSRLPIKLVYTEKLPDRSTAMKRERAIKRLPRAKKSELVKAAIASRNNLQTSRGKDD
jgi:putative endonuclease